MGGEDREEDGRRRMTKRERAKGGAAGGNEVSSNEEGGAGRGRKQCEWKNEDTRNIEHKNTPHSRHYSPTPLPALAAPPPPPLAPLTPALPPAVLRAAEVADTRTTPHPRPSGSAGCASARWSLTMGGRVDAVRGGMQGRVERREERRGEPERDKSGDWGTMLQRQARHSVLLGGMALPRTTASLPARPQLRTVCGPAAALYLNLKEAIHATYGERDGRKGKRARHVKPKYASPLSFCLPVGVYSPPRSQSLRNSWRCTARTRRAPGRAAHTVHVHRTRSQLRAQSRSLCGTRFDEMRGGGVVKLARSNAYLLPTPFAAVLSANYLLGFLMHRPRIHLAANTPRDVLLQRLVASPHIASAAPSRAFVPYTSVSFRDNVLLRDSDSGSQGSGNIRLTYTAARRTPREPLHTALCVRHLSRAGHILASLPQLSPRVEAAASPCRSLPPNAAAAYTISLVACASLSAHGTCVLVGHDLLSPVGNAMTTSPFVVLPVRKAPRNLGLEGFWVALVPPRLDRRRVDRIDIIAHEVAATLDGAVACVFVGGCSLRE
ncbi:hypothetical protein C8R44DRAFT_913029 [Mycena epipterygia]|nr:hypothetical protein C8R44DRAFT_913029 [Mycena epipterygia]